MFWFGDFGVSSFGTWCSGLLFFVWQSLLFSGCDQEGYFVDEFSICSNFCFHSWSNGRTCLFMLWNLDVMVLRLLILYAYCFCRCFLWIDVFPVAAEIGVFWVCFFVLYHDNVSCIVFLDYTFWAPPLVFGRFEPFIHLSREGKKKRKRRGKKKNWMVLDLGWIGKVSIVSRRLKM